MSFAAGRDPSTLANSPSQVPSCLPRVVPRDVPRALGLASSTTGVLAHERGHVHRRLRSRVRSFLSLANHANPRCRLGDRHCENILIDETNGDTVHVDFNCLFDKVRPFAVHVTVAEHC